MSSRRSAALALGTTVALVLASSLPAVGAPTSTAPASTVPTTTSPKSPTPATTAPKPTAPKTATAPKSTAPKTTTTTPPPVLQGRGYVGETSQKASGISIVLTKDRKRIKTVDVEWNERASQCTNGLPYVSNTKFGRPSAKTLPLSLTGAFKSTYPFVVTIPGVAELTETSTIKGRIGPERATGTFRATVLLKDSTGKEVNRCDSGRIAWTADQ